MENLNNQEKFENENGSVNPGSNSSVSKKSKLGIIIAVVIIAILVGVLILGK